MKSTVVIVDDHTIVREGLQLLLEAHDDVQVVGHASDGHGAIELVRNLHPSLVIMDISLPGMGGIEATRIIRRDEPDTQVCILSMHANLDYLYQSLSAGASGYVLKEAAGNEVVAAIRTIVSGERYLSHKIIDLLLANFQKQYQTSQSEALLEGLSPREYEILKRVVAGQSSKEIAQTLSLSPKTVETYRSRMMEKLGVHDLPSLIRLGIESGIDIPL